MSAIDQWEEEAKGIEYGTKSADRILSLIELVRKKDDALKIIIGRNSIFETEGKIGREALQLTEDLK